MKLNITSKVLNLFVAAALSLTACGDKDDDAQPVVDQTACKLTELYDDNGQLVAEYNANGYISKLTELDVDGEEENEYEYTIQYTYDNSNRLIKEEYFLNGEDDGYNTYEYANNLVSKMKSYYEGELNITATLTYDANKRITAITRVMAGSTEQYTMTFAYNSAGNVTQRDNKYMGETLSSVKYENYDNKLTPFAAIKGLVNIYDGSSRNNPGKATETNYWNGEPETSVTNFTYQYNDKNLPTRITEVSDGDTYITNFTYQCN